MEYEEAARWVFGLTDYEKSSAIVYSPDRFDLRRVESLLARFSNPHLGPVTVHIAGTKGKGSTAALVTSILSAAGYHTGLFTSPHLLSPTERIVVDGSAISEPDFSRLVGILQPQVEEMNREALFGQITTFEVLAVLAFLYFREQGVETQVLETGMGGRLDATNVCEPAVCVITSLSLDHTEVLGETLEAIAGEKAGIVKRGVSVVSAPQPPEARAVLEVVCQKKEAPLIKVEEAVHTCKGESDLVGQHFSLRTPLASYNLWMPLLGAFQLENAACAVAGVERLNEGLLPRTVSAEAIALGVRQVHWPGRLQVLQQGPLLVVDGAHNVYSMERLKQAVRESFHFTRLVLIIGTSCDKDSDGIVWELVELRPRVIATRSTHPRATPPGALAKAFRSRGVAAATTPTVGEALVRALRWAHTDDLILVTGSLFVVAEALAYWKEGRDNESIGLEGPTTRSGHCSGRHYSPGPHGRGVLARAGAGQVGHH